MLLGVRAMNFVVEVLVTGALLACCFSVYAMQGLADISPLQHTAHMLCLAPTPAAKQMTGCFGTPRWGCCLQLSWSACLLCWPAMEKCMQAECKVLVCLSWGFQLVILGAALLLYNAYPGA